MAFGQGLCLYVPVSWRAGGKDRREGDREVRGKEKRMSRDETCK